MAKLNGTGYLGVLTAFGAQRLLEMRLSRRNLTRAPRGTTASPQTFPLMVAVHCALFALPGITRYGRQQASAPVRAASVMALGAAVALRLWAIRTLGAQWNVRASVPLEMTPVLDGPYRWIRHPNYVAVGLEFAALPTLGGGYVEAVALSLANAAVLWPRIRAEEALLDQIPDYREAFEGFPRFVPRGLHPRQRNPVSS